jgi:tRNA threonylcarbamoyladenosine biosynthesis protein TsaB
MNLLAFDTSSNACSVALQVDDQVFERHVIQVNQHTRILIPMIRNLLSDADIDLQSIDVLVLGNGPGSFIGMRIAASVAQGLAFGSKQKIVPVSSMAAVAAEVIDLYSSTEVIVAQDARMNEVYLGIYRVNGEGLPVADSAEILQPIEPITKLDENGSSERVAAGQGWQRYPALLNLNQTAISKVVDVYYPKARYLLGLGAKGWQCGDAIEPENLVPAYIRTKVAEKSR